MSETLKSLKFFLKECASVSLMVFLHLSFQINHVVTTVMLPCSKVIKADICTLTEGISASCLDDPLSQ